MENTKSPFDKLFGESLPRLLQAIDEYHALAVPHCTPELIQLLAELQRRIKQREFLLRNVAAIEERLLAAAMNVLAAADAIKFNAWGSNLCAKLLDRASLRVQEPIRSWRNLVRPCT